MDDTAAVQPGLADFETRTFGEVTCIKGDCLIVMPRLANQSVSLVFADLPYAVKSRTVTANAWDKVFDLKTLWMQLERIKHKNTPCVFTSIQPFSSNLVHSNAKDFRYELIYVKDTPTGFLQANKMPLRKHESVLVFYKKLPVYNPQKTPGLPYKTNAGRVDGWYNDNNYRKIPLRPRVNISGDRYPVSVLSLANKDKRTRLHPTQKPVALLEWLITTYTNPGDLILDPTAGSGTTGCAALNLGRRAILIEKDPAYFEVMCKRIAEHQQKMEAACE